MKRTLCVVVLLLGLLIMSSQALGQVVTRTVLFEDPNPRATISHWLLKIGTAQGGPYPTVVQIDMPQPPPPEGQEITIPDVELTLAAGTYYAVISAVNLESIESGNSDESPQWSVLGPPLTIINLRITVPPPPPPE